MNGKIWAAIFLATLSACKERSVSTHPPAQKGAPHAENDLSVAITGNVFPNPKVRNNHIARDQISDPKKIVAAVQAALSAAPSWTMGDAEAFDRHNSFVDHALAKTLPLNGEHWITVQCGEVASFDQRFMYRDALSNTIRVTVPQLHNSDIEAARTYDDLLVHTMGDYTRRLLNLGAQFPDTPVIPDQHYFDPMIKPLEEVERKLALDGSSVKITSASKIVLLNSPFATLGELRIESFVTEAQSDFLAGLLQHSSVAPGLENEIDGEKKFWQEFPSSDPGSVWYGEIPAPIPNREVCILLRLKNLYAPIIRPGQLLDIGIGKAGQSDLTAAFNGWYIVDRFTGEVIAGRSI